MKDSVGNGNNKHRGKILVSIGVLASFISGAAAVAMTAWSIRHGEMAELKAEVQERVVITERLRVIGLRQQWIAGAIVLLAEKQGVHLPPEPNGYGYGYGYGYGPPPANK